STPSVEEPCREGNDAPDCVCPASAKRESYRHPGAYEEIGWMRPTRRGTLTTNGDDACRLQCSGERMCRHERRPERIATADDVRRLPNARERGGCGRRDRKSVV